MTPIAISDWPARFLKRRGAGLSAFPVFGTKSSVVPTLGVSLKDEGLGTDLETGFESDCWFGFRGGSSCLLWLEGGPQRLSSGWRPLHEAVRLHLRDRLHSLWRWMVQQPPQFCQPTGKDIQVGHVLTGS